MKSNEQILDEFGNLIAQEVFDKQYKFILNGVVELSDTEDYKNLFKEMNLEQKKEIELYTREVLKGSLFDFLRIFEENTHFKLIYDNDEQQLDLNKISQMLKSEPIIENGWIDRFSKETLK